MVCRNKLHSAIIDDDYSMINYLSTEMPDIDKCCDCRRSLLCSAIRNKSESALNFLLNSQCDINITDEDYELNALAICIEKRNYKLAISMIERGIDINVINQYGLTLFGVAVADSRNLDFVDLLIDNGGDINVCDDTNTSILQRSVYYGNPEMVVHVLKYVQDIDLLNKHDKTALGISLICGYDEIASILIKSGADVNLKNKEGFSYLHTVVKYNYTKTPKLILLLLENGCCINHSNKFNVTALGLTLEVDRLLNRKNEDTIKMLIKYWGRLNIQKLNFCHLKFIEKEMVLFLHVNGIQFEIGKEEAWDNLHTDEMKSLLKWLKSPLSLFHLTRLFIRSHLEHCNDNMLLPKLLHVLPIPSFLCEFLDVECYVK